ncbi:MAG: nucleotidyl transferase AbiEii/AbiGii toxin family protein [Ignavibacteriae bacterium]|nr:nucleotidyl transferase AbiEii/AbiGii toxin family protein [Ignavibacteriota bacterium]
MLKEIDIHRNYIVRILKDIYTNPEISPILGFKGGTAAYLLYGLGRFSVDIDLDLLNQEKAEIVFGLLEKILKNYGALKENHKKKNTIFYMVSYAEETQNIKVEISTRNFNSKYELKNFLGLSLNVMVKEDMFAHKLVALYERKGKSARDIFDVNYFLKCNWGFNEDIIKTRTGLKTKEFIGKCIKIVKDKSSRNLLAGIGELLTPEKKEWVKRNLISDTVFLMENLKSQVR